MSANQKNNSTSQFFCAIYELFRFFFCPVKQSEWEREREIFSGIINFTCLCTLLIWRVEFFLISHPKNKINCRKKIMFAVRLKPIEGWPIMVVFSLIITIISLKPPINATHTPSLSRSCQTGSTTEHYRKLRYNSLSWFSLLFRKTFLSRVADWN